MKILHISLILMVADALKVAPLDMIKNGWKSFILQHKKTFESIAEENNHIKIFIKNQMHIAQHNEKYATGLVSYSLKENKFTDVLFHEFVHTMNGFNVSLAQHFPAVDGVAIFVSPDNVTIPNHVDWREAGAVTPVKEQGKCRACWSFSATGALEGQHFRQTGMLVSLSEQNLIDCSSAYGNNGCNGGLMDNAFQYIKDNGGIDTESSYPYEAITGTCRHKFVKPGANNFDLVRIPSGDEKKLMEAIATAGPVSAAIDASMQSFQFYNDGVYYNEMCSDVNLDHGVLVVGYGTEENGGDFWLVKNSWGTSWGLDGYIKIARNRNNHCGIATSASYLRNPILN